MAYDADGIWTPDAEPSAVTELPVMSAQEVAVASRPQPRGQQDNELPVMSAQELAQAQTQHLPVMSKAEIDKFTPTESPLATGIRHFVHAVPSVLTGLGAGALYGAAGGPGGIIGGALVGGGAALVESYAQSKATEALWPEEAARLQAGAEANPKSATVGGVAAAGPFIGVGGLTKEALKASVGQRAISALLTGGTDVGAQLATTGTVDPTQAAIQTAGGAVFGGAPTALGQKVIGSAEQLGARYRPRPVPHGPPGSEAAAGVAQEAKPTTDPAATENAAVRAAKPGPEDYGKQSPPGEGGAGVNVGDVDPTLAHAINLGSTPQRERPVEAQMREAGVEPRRPGEPLQTATPEDIDARMRAAGVPEPRAPYEAPPLGAEREMPSIAAAERPAEVLRGPEPAASAATVGDQLKAKQAERVAAAAKPPLKGGYQDTRGQGVQFHGASKEVSLTEGNYGASDAYYGTHSLYTTDALDAAHGYANKRKATAPTIYEVQPPQNAKIYDMEKPITPEVRAQIDEIASSRYGDAAGIAESALSENPKNLREFFDHTREYASGERVPADEIQESVFHPIMDYLSDQGYHGMSHRGGLRTKTPEHNVTIYFEPEKNVRLRKMEESELVGLRGPEPAASAATVGDQLKAKQAEKVAAAEKPPLYPHAALPKAKLEKALEKARAESSKITDELIAAGRGREKGQDIGKQTDELSQRYKANSDLVMSLADERNRRMTWGGTLKPIPEANRDSFYGGRQPMARTPLDLIRREPTERGISGRPIKTEPLPIGTEQAILERGAEKATGPRLPPEQAPPELQPARRQPAQPGSVEAARENIQARIAVKPPWREKLPGSWKEVKDIGNRLYADFKNEFDPLEQSAKKDPTLTPDENFSTLARLTNGLRGRVMQSLGYEPGRVAKAFGAKGGHDGTYDILTRQKNGESLTTILKPVEQDLEGFTTYAIAKRAIELHGRNIKTGIDIADANQVVAADTARFESTFRELNGYQDRLLDNLQKSGILSKVQVAQMRALNKQFVPFYRLIDPKSDLGQHVGGGLKTWDPVHGIKGSERQLLDPIDSIVRNTYVFTAMAERNIAMQALEKFALSNPKGAGLLRRISGMRPVEVTSAELQKFMDAHGIPANVQDTLNIFRPTAFKPDENTVRIFSDGKARIYEVSDPAIAKSINALDREQLNWALKVMSYPASLLRAGAVLSPEFIARNPVRDQFSAFINSKHGYLPVYDMLRGASDLVQKGAMFQKWMIEGGANATLVGMDRKTLGMDPKTLAGQVKSVITSPIEALRVVTELMENATRLGEFRRAIETGKTPREAALASRDVTLDFARNGAKGRALNAIIPFWNAQVEGVDRTARAFKDNPMGTLTKVGLSITAPSVALWFANKDDPRYQELPQWQKDLFWIIPTDNWVNMKTEDAAGIGDAHKRQLTDGSWQRNDGTIYRIPKPFEVGVIFGSLPERMLEAFYRENPKAFKNLGDTLWKGFVPGVIPQAITPMVEQFSNRSTFQDRTLVPKYMENLPPAKQFTPHTSETAKTLGNIISTINPKTSFASPIIIDNYIRGYTGGLGQYVVGAMDKMLEPSDAAAKPAWTAADTPLLKAFAVRFPSAGAQSIQDFYDIWADRKTSKAEIGQAKKAHDPEQAELRREGAALKAADPIHKQIGQMHQKIANTTLDKTMSPEDKREIIDTTYLKMINAAKRGVENFERRKELREQNKQQQGGQYAP